MEFRHLRYFLVLAEELHFGRAASRLAITQPPLSLNIQQLEKAIGTRLFERDSKGVRLTAAGAAFRESARMLLAQAEDAQQLARDIGAGAAGRLHIGFVGSMLLRGLPQWLEQFGTSHPRIVLELEELNSQQQIDALMRGQLDLGFAHTDRLPAGLRAQRVLAEPFVCCLPATHPLAQRRGRISLAQMRDEPFVLFARGVSPDYYNRIIEACAAQGFAPRIRHETRHWLSVVSLVGQGLGLSIVPASLARSGMVGAVFRPIAEPLAPSEVFAVWPEAPDLPARQDFVDLARKHPGPDMKLRTRGPRRTSSPSPRKLA